MNNLSSHHEIANMKAHPYFEQFLVQLQLYDHDIANRIAWWGKRRLYYQQKWHSCQAHPIRLDVEGWCLVETITRAHLETVLMSHAPRNPSKQAERLYSASIGNRGEILFQSLFRLKTVIDLYQNLSMYPPTSESTPKPQMGSSNRRDQVKFGNLTWLKKNTWMILLSRGTETVRPLSWQCVWLITWCWRDGSWVTKNGSPKALWRLQIPKLTSDPKKTLYKRIFN